MKINLSRVLPYTYNLVCQLLWAGAVIVLPITSYPLLVKLTPSSTVAPLTTIFLAVLGLVWFLPRLLGVAADHRGGKLLAESKPLLWFVLAAAAAWGVSFFGEIPAFRERSNLTEGLKAFLTLGVGLVAYFVPAAWLSADRKHLQRTLMWINLAGALVIAWSLVQAYFVILQSRGISIQARAVPAVVFLTARRSIDPIAGDWLCLRTLLAGAPAEPDISAGMAGSHAEGILGAA